MENSYKTYETSNREFQYIVLIKYYITSKELYNISPTILFGYIYIYMQSNFVNTKSKGITKILILTITYNIQEDTLFIMRLSSCQLSVFITNQSHKGRIVKQKFGKQFCTL